MVVKYCLCKFLYSHFLLLVEKRVPTDTTACGSLLPGKPHLGGEKGSGDFLVTFSLPTHAQASDAVTLPGGISTAPNQALRSYSKLPSSDLLSTCLRGQESALSGLRKQSSKHFCVSLSELPPFPPLAPRCLLQRHLWQRSMAKDNVIWIYNHPIINQWWQL